MPRDEIKGVPIYQKGKPCRYIKPPNLKLCQEGTCADCEIYRKVKEGDRNAQ